MVYCYEMKVGDIYACRWCGFEIEIIKAGEDLGLADDSNNCGLKGDFSTLRCCGQPLDKKI